MDRTDGGTTPLHRAPRVDLLAVLKGAMATVIALPLLDALGLRSAWALVVGCAVIEVEKRNHAAGRRERPSTVALALAGLAAMAAVTLIVIGG